MSSFKNNFECEATLMSTKPYYCLRGRNKNKIWSQVKLGGGGGGGCSWFVKLKKLKFVFKFVQPRPGEMNSQIQLNFIGLSNVAWEPAWGNGPDQSLRILILMPLSAISMRRF